MCNVYLLYVVEGYKAEGWSWGVILYYWLVVIYVFYMVEICIIFYL